ncbi:hypothetical protein C7C46_21360 [Streptomyces tateyamensis]|uniref:LysM domain-containing protein n=1 Tax=Streptomyces tateyamensis TaxID=565073 RepID=A0A2V4NC92_9ACTN|nr:LysM peptidoglycan-binding domain-containing protein [Streptomyces tateyamensis]PYC76740.1 hypothetical protein C7C46_21360 [Streptomyces tateyamensis]
MAAPRTKARARAGSSRDGQAPAGSRRPVPAPLGRRRSPLRLLPGAVLALALLALLLGGVPLLLWHGTQVVAAMGGEGHRSLRELLTTPDDGRLFLWALVAIGWVAWACFAFAVLLEVPAQLRGRVVRRIPAFGWSQRMAAGLVGAVIAVLPVAGGAFAATAGPGQLTAASAPAQLAAAPRYQALAAAPVSAPTAALPAADPVGRPSYTVKDTRPADSLWSIAEHQLGSGDRWQEIAKLNAGRVMDSSGDTFDADRPIQPGWQLLMPADAKPDPATGAAPAAAAPAPPAAQGGGARHASVTVREGDSLSAIAQRELGDAQAWPQLFDANKGVQAPDGARLTDPNMLEPGMVLNIPGTPAAAAPAPAPAPAATPQSAPVPDGPSETYTPDPAPHPRAALPRPVAPSPAPPAPSVRAVPSAAPAQSAPAPAQQTPAPARQTPAHAKPAHAAPAQEDYTGALAASAVGVLLAAVLVGAVAQRRGAQQRARKPRHRIPMPKPAAASFEAELKARQNSTGLDLLNRALRTLARNVARTGRRLPPLAAVRVTGGGTIELHLATGTPPIAPFRAAHASTVWWCSADSADLLSAEQAAKVPAPYPSLVTLGTAADGAAVLADLETVRLLHLAGHPDDARAVLRTIALELAHSPLADKLNLHLIGFPDDLPVSDTVADRVCRYPTLEAALAALGPRTARARATLVGIGAGHPREARSRGQADEAWVPEIVLSAQPPIGEVPAELGRLLDGRPRTCLAVIARAPERGAGPVARWTLPATGPATLPGLNIALQLQRLTDEQYGHWRELLTTAASPTQEPAPSWTYDGDELEPADLPVPVLAGVGAANAPFVGASLPDGPPEAGPKLIARLISTGTSPFATVNPGAAALPPGLHVINGLGRQANSGSPVPREPVAALDPAPAPAGAPFPPVDYQAPGPFAGPQPEYRPDPLTDALPTPDPRSATDYPVPAEPQSAGPDLLPAAGGNGFVPFPPAAADGDFGQLAGPGRRPPEDYAPAPEPAPTHEAAAAPTAPEAQLPARPDPVPVAPPAGPARTDADDLLAILRSPEAHAIRTTPRVRLLGPVDVLGAPGPLDPAALPKLTELAAYLALHPGADPAAAARALDPGDHARAEPTAPASLADLAAWMGADPDGRAFLRQDVLDSYTFAPTVTCDWDEFRSLYRRGMRSTSTTADAALAHALALVRGAPFAETDTTGYGWAEAIRQDMLAAVVDTAHELAARRLQYGDHRSAEAAIFRGLAVAPDVELLHRDLFYAYASAGARDQLLKAVNRLDALSRRTGRSLDPDTVTLLRDLLSGA